MNILNFVKENFTNMMSVFSNTRKEHTDTLVGAGYYVLRETTSASGNIYTKLVVADQSPALRIRERIKPITGMRHPEKRTGRRKVKAQTQIKE